MDQSYFFYDLETSGISPKKDRIMQFAGQRTDTNLQPIGDPVNLTLRLSPDVLPSPHAILLTGLSPLEGLKTGISEAEFTDIFNSQVAIPGTMFVGFNNLRFDDEFIRYLNYRNFYDAYSWHWKDGSSRWDLLDMVRMTRALRPEGITWPINDEGKASNRLEHLARANKLNHHHAHDALSDALATIELAKLLKSKQPKLFDYILSIRSKTKLLELIRSQPLLIYTSSHYPSETLHTTIVRVLSIDDKTGSALVYDLRHSPSEFLDSPVDDLVALWEYNPDRDAPRLPVKTMKLNRCPAIAPLSVLDEPSITRLKLNMDEIYKHSEVIAASQDKFVSKLRQVIKKLDGARDKRLSAGKRFFSADEALYDNFVDGADSRRFKEARAQAGSKSASITFKDRRLSSLYTLYRARNYLTSLTSEELATWQEHVYLKLFNGEDSQFASFERDLALVQSNNPTKKQQQLIVELNKYAQAIASEYGAR